MATSITAWMPARAGSCCSRPAIGSTASPSRTRSAEDSFMEMTNQADPTKDRYVKSYAIRRAFRDEIQHPPAISGVSGAIDIHCHAHEGQQDALDVAKHASRSGMGGILYKTIFGRHRPAESMRRVHTAVNRWADEEQVAPIQVWSGWGVARGGQLATVEETREMLDDGVSAVWMPVANSA